MKKTLIKIFAVLAAAIFVLTSCQSTKKAKEPDPNFIADMDPIYLGKIIGLNKQNLFKPKPCEVDIYFYPRSSCYGARFRDGMNKVALVFTPEETKSLVTAFDKYNEIKENNGFVKNYKPGRKNNFTRGKVTILWGATGYGREVDGAPYNTNYEVLDNKPYFRLKVDAANYPEEEHVGSPTVSLYFTPGQLEELLAITDMSIIMKNIEDFNKAAYEFDESDILDDFDEIESADESNGLDDFE